MWLCNVVDTSIDEDREYLDFWYADTIYGIRVPNRMYKARKISFGEWLQENTKFDCVYVPKPTKENQL